GLSESEALALVTLNPAKQLGIDRWVGSIDQGKDADLVLYNHHPFSPMALPQKVFIDGLVYFDREQDLQRRKQLEETKRRLREEDDRSMPRGSRPRPSDASGPGDDHEEWKSGRVEEWTPRTFFHSPTLPFFHSLPIALGQRPDADSYAIRNARIFP